MAKISIETDNDVILEANRVQDQIIEYLGLRSSDLKFEFSMIDGKTKLDLITINPRHNQSFLFHSATGTDKVDALKKMWKYVQNYKEKENSYTIQWTTKSDSELHTSYFRASNILDVLEKLYYGRDRNTITVFSVVLNPIS
jgi:predicted ATP-grasp superfamily ATP-dependent carboligase